MPGGKRHASFVRQRWQRYGWVERGRRGLRTAASRRRAITKGGVSEAVCKPSSVPGRLREPGDGHPSGAVSCPTARAADPRAGQRTSPPANRVAPSYLALLRVEFAAFHSGVLADAGIVTVALVLASRRTGVTRYPALRSSDFPHAGRASPATRDHPTASLT